MVMFARSGSSLKRSRGQMMAYVACFCGCQYSFRGDAGVCPHCGEYVSLTRPSAAEENEMREALSAIFDEHDIQRVGNKAIDDE